MPIRLRATQNVIGLPFFSLGVVSELNESETVLLYYIQDMYCTLHNTIECFCLKYHKNPVSFVNLIWITKVLDI